jgi:hypothetical protein
MGPYHRPLPIFRLNMEEVRFILEGGAVSGPLSILVFRVLQLRVRRYGRLHVDVIAS